MTFEKLIHTAIFGNRSIEKRQVDSKNPQKGFLLIEESDHLLCH